MKVEGKNFVRWSIRLSLLDNNSHDHRRRYSPNFSYDFGQPTDGEWSIRGSGTTFLMIFGTTTGDAHGAGDNFFVFYL